MKPVLLSCAAVLLSVLTTICCMSQTSGGSTDTETGGVVAGTIIDNSGVLL